jgi:hypothetical protein
MPDQTGNNAVVTKQGHGIGRMWTPEASSKIWRPGTENNGHHDILDGWVSRQGWQLGNARPETARQGLFIGIYSNKSNGH